MVPEIRPFFHGRRSGLSFFRKFFICSLALAFTAFITSPEQIHCEPLSLGETTEMGADLDMGTNSIILGGESRSSWPEGLADNLGNHTASQNIKLDGNWISGDGDSEGLYVDNSGDVGIGVPYPIHRFEVKRTLTNNITPIAVFNEAGSGSAAAIRFLNASGQHFNVGVRSDGEFAVSTQNANIGLSTDLIRIDSAGQIAIKNASVIAPLQVDGCIIAHGPYNNNHVATKEYADYIACNPPGNTDLHGCWISGDGDDEGIFVELNGYVGIGTSSPTEKLSVVGNITAHDPTEDNHVATKSYVDSRTTATMISELHAYALFTTHMETCRNMTAACEYQIDGTCDATTYDDWRLPTAEELALFVGIDTEATSYLYTRTPSYSTEGEYVVMKISDGDWFGFPAVIGSYANARCVR